MSEVPKTFQEKNQVPRNDQFLFILYKKMSFWGSTKGAPTTGVVELWKKIIYCNEYQRNWVVFLEKWMNMFTGDLYSMYIILQGIGSLSYIRVYIIYKIPFGEQQAWISEVPKKFQQKNSSPEMINFFLYCIKKWISEAHRRRPPTTGVVELW